MTCCVSRLPSPVGDVHEEAPRVPYQVQTSQQPGQLTQEVKTAGNPVQNYPSQEQQISPLEGTRERRRPISAHQRYDLEQQLMMLDESKPPNAVPPRRSESSSNPSSLRRPLPDPPGQGYNSGQGYYGGAGNIRTRHYSGHELGQISRSSGQQEEQEVRRQASWESANKGVMPSQNFGPIPSSAGPDSVVPYHSRSSSMEGVGKLTGFTNSGQQLQTNSLGRNKTKSTSQSFSLPPQDSATYTSEKVLHFNSPFSSDVPGETKNKRPASAGNASRRTSVNTPEASRPTDIGDMSFSSRKPPLVPRQSPGALGHKRSSSMEGLIDGFEQQRSLDRPRLKSFGDLDSPPKNTEKQSGQQQVKHQVDPSYRSDQMVVKYKNDAFRSGNRSLFFISL